MKQLFSIFLGLLIFSMYVWIVRHREGFEVGKTPADFLKILKTGNDAKHGNLNIAVYKQNYQDMITELDRYTDLAMLELIAQPDVTKLSGFTFAKNFSQMLEFKKNLTEFKTTVANIS
jgi:hypothetical protein